uniref:Uncharacterized protein n=1 Tax=Romanomermis culicivorax TaxID=13658 RepID=A0A915K2F2_ROMCU
MGMVTSYMRSSMTQELGIQALYNSVYPMVKSGLEKGKDDETNARNNCKAHFRARLSYTCT